MSIYQEMRIAQLQSQLDRVNVELAAMRQMVAQPVTNDGFGGEIPAVFAPIGQAPGGDVLLPWTVRWSDQDNCYVIYLPDPFSLLYWGLEAVGVSNITQAQGMPFGWYKIEESTKETEQIVLVVKYNSDTGDFISAKVQPYGGGMAKGTLNILIAWPHRMENDALVIRQFAASVIHLGSGNCSCPDIGYPEDGKEEDQDIVTGVEWDEDSYCLVIHRAHVTIKGGHIIDWAALPDAHIETVSHSDVTGA